MYSLDANYGTGDVMIINTYMILKVIFRKRKIKKMPENLKISDILRMLTRITIRDYKRPQEPGSTPTRPQRPT